MNTQMDLAWIECRSQSQAHDWSLVLISQGIESTITRRPEDGAWRLEVAAADRELAVESIRAYRRENASRWRREMKWTGLLFDSRAGLWFAALVAFHFFVARTHADFRGQGLMDAAAVRHGEWWRIFTAMTLHGDVGHLMANATTGLVFLGLAMGAYGAGNALLFSILGGALGNLATLTLHEAPFRSLGASGLVMAALGLITAHSLIGARGEKRALWLGRGLIAGGLLVVLLGFSPGSDVTAHVGGFLGGLGLGFLAQPMRGKLHRPALNALCFAVQFVLLILCWWLALR